MDGVFEALVAPDAAVAAFEAVVDAVVTAPTALDAALLAMFDALDAA